VKEHVGDVAHAVEERAAEVDGRGALERALVGGLGRDTRELFAGELLEHRLVVDLHEVHALRAEPAVEVLVEPRGVVGRDEGAVRGVELRRPADELRRSVAAGDDAVAAGERPARVHALPVALERVPDADVADAEFLLREAHDRGEAAGEFSRVGGEVEDAAVAHLLPAVVDDEEAGVDAALGEFREAARDTRGGDLLVEGVPGAPAEAVDEGRGGFLLAPAKCAERLLGGGDGGGDGGEGVAVGCERKGGFVAPGAGAAIRRPRGGQPAFRVRAEDGAAVFADQWQERDAVSVGAFPEEEGDIIAAGEVFGPVGEGGPEPERVVPRDRETVPHAWQVQGAAGQGVGADDGAGVRRW